MFAALVATMVHDFAEFCFYSDDMTTIKNLECILPLINNCEGKPVFIQKKGKIT